MSVDSCSQFHVTSWLELAFSLSVHKPLLNVKEFAYSQLLLPTVLAVIKFPWKSWPIILPSPLFYFFMIDMELLGSWLCLSFFCHIVSSDPVTSFFSWKAADNWRSRWTMMVTWTRKWNLIHSDGVWGQIAHGCFLSFKYLENVWMKKTVSQEFHFPRKVLLEMASHSGRPLEYTNRVEILDIF